MVYVVPGLYVRICQLDVPAPPQPLPLRSGFSSDFAYKVLGLHAPSETSEAYLILSNDEEQIWFISNRHLRVHAVVPHSLEFRIAIPERSERAA